MNKTGTGRRAIGVVLALLFMATGVWVISMAVKGETPAQPLDQPGARVRVGVLGAMFCAISVLGIVHAWLLGRAKGPAVTAGLMTAVCVLFGLCFLIVAVLQPGEIISRTSVNRHVVSVSKGHWSGAAAFAIFGALPLIFARQIYRVCKKTLERNG